MVISHIDPLSFPITGTESEVVTPVSIEEIPDSVMSVRLGAAMEWVASLQAAPTAAERSRAEVPSVVAPDSRFILADNRPSRFFSLLDSLAWHGDVPAVRPPKRTQPIRRKSEKRNPERSGFSCSCSRTHGNHDSKPAQPQST